MHGIFVTLTGFIWMTLLALNTSAQADRVVGVWFTEDRESKVEIYKTSSGAYEGKLVWLEDPRNEDGSVKRDTENPERGLRSRPLEGMVLLEDFRFSSSSEEWKDGTIYDPESGRTYSAYMRLEDNNTLKIRGYVMGMRLLGRNTTWKRE